MKRKEETVTRDQVREAIKRFKKNGGLANKLPDQVTPARNLVGAKFGALETVISRTAVGNE